MSVFLPTGIFGAFHWRATTLMLKRYVDKALERADELAADSDHDGADTWCRITAAVEQPANTTPLDRNEPVPTRHPPIRFILDNRFIGWRLW
jgi:hypothetical protein